MPCIRGAVDSCLVKQLPKSSSEFAFCEWSIVFKVEQKAWAVSPSHHVVQEGRHWAESLISLPNMDVDTLAEGVSFGSFQADANDIRLSYIIYRDVGKAQVD